MSQFYGVWIGRNPGVYDNWNDCKSQVDKFAGAKYKKLLSTTYNEALNEFNQNAITAVANSPKTTTINNANKNHSNAGVPEKDVLTVDGASNGKNCEFRAVWYPSNKEVFASKTYDGGTNNIAEFLGLIFALKYLIKNEMPLKVYTDSVTAMAWVRNGKANTTAHTTGKATEELNNLITKSETFLRENKLLLSKAQILKWETKAWGEIPADYGRK